MCRGSGEGAAGVGGVRANLGVEGCDTLLARWLGRGFQGRNSAASPVPAELQAIRWAGRPKYSGYSEVVLGGAEMPRCTC